MRNVGFVGTVALIGAAMLMQLQANMTGVVVLVASGFVAFFLCAFLAAGRRHYQEAIECLQQQGLSAEQAQAAVVLEARAGRATARVNGLCFALAGVVALAVGIGVTVLLMPQNGSGRILLGTIFMVGTGLLLFLRGLGQLLTGTVHQ
ncbi:MAG TPA: hypothetical protein VEL76_29125 [Gemmataceae bacterium]|nr:hypothetical protein [Gemmataceae bacterium]